MKQLLFVLFIILTPNLQFAQEYVWENYTSKKDMHDIVLFNDYLWVASSGG